MRPTLGPPYARGGRPRRTCTFAACGQPYHARGLCPQHYQMAYYDENAVRKRAARRDRYYRRVRLAGETTEDRREETS